MAPNCDPHFFCLKLERYLPTRVSGAMQHPASKTPRAPAAGRACFPTKAHRSGGCLGSLKHAVRNPNSEIPWRYGFRRAGSSYDRISRRLLLCNTRVKNGDFGLSLRFLNSKKMPNLRPYVPSWLCPTLTPPLAPQLTAQPQRRPPSRCSLLQCERQRRGGQLPSRLSSPFLPCCLL